MGTIKIIEVQCEYRNHLLGTDLLHPRFSWKMESTERNTRQSAYQLQVTKREDQSFESPLWDTGRMETDQSIQLPYAGSELIPCTSYLFRVRVWDQSGNESDWSAAGQLETGLQRPDAWQAHWITPDTQQIDRESDPIFQLRRSFEIKGEIASARIYATAAGVYELYLNGQPVSVDVLAPGWTSYHHRMQYQTYDVTSLIQPGANAVGAWLGDGWYRGKLGFDDKQYTYGEHRALLMQMLIRYTDGTEEWVLTDSSWRASIGPIPYSNIYHGETYDARLEQSGWSSPDFDDHSWHGVETVQLSCEPLISQENWPTRVTETIQPVQYIVTPAGEHVLDMGQNMVGRIRMTLGGAAAGTTITIRHAEVLDKDGNIYYGNLRPARQTVTYIAGGAEQEEYAPHFSFMGFRYIQVSGYPGQETEGLPLDAFVGEVLHSDMPSTGEFECSDERVNQLQRNIRWGQRGNFLDVPTDCPQRDERLGWTGDAQVFISTALFNYQGAPFFTKWLHDVQAEQHEDGGIPFVVPDIVGGANSAAWGDAAVICPWTFYQYYGDRQLLAEQYDSMKKWVDYIHSQGEEEFLWNTGFHFGDWLALDASEGSYIGATPTALIATAYYAYSSRLVAEAAQILGKQQEAEQYRRLHEDVVQMFRAEFVTARGRIAAPTQTAHVLALMFNLVEPEMKIRVAADLNDLIVSNDYHLTTGFVGTPYLCFALSDNGYHQTAVRLLLQESYPGWLYSVSQGATTIWEHWDSLKPDGSFWSDDMNSFNHYSYGAVGDWMYRRIAGLDKQPEQPAYQRIRIEPLFGTRQLTHARAAHESMYGRIESGWKMEEGRMMVQVTVPVNTTADILLHGAQMEQLSESGRSVHEMDGVITVDTEDDAVHITVGSGQYTFSYPADQLFQTSYTPNTRLSELLMDEQAVDVLNRHAPQLVQGSLSSMVSASSLQQIADNQMARIPQEKMQQIVAELQLL